MSIFNVYKTSSLLVFSFFCLSAETIENPPVSPSPQAAVPVVPLVPEKALQILNFWIGGSSDLAASGKADIDRVIRGQFSQDMQQAANGELNSWRETPQGRLALILLLDQFPRYLNSDNAQAFAFDAMAIGLVLEGLQKGDDKKLQLLERAFFYLPLQHAEDPRMQTLSVSAYQQLVEQTPDPLKPQMQKFLDDALVHQQVIARFGRFPHRNALLGRESTPEEIIYLRDYLRIHNGLNSNSFPLGACKNKGAIFDNMTPLFSRLTVQAPREKIISNLGH